MNRREYFYVERGDEFDVIWTGSPGTGDKAADRAANFFPRYFCTCQSKGDAEQIAVALDRLLRYENTADV